MAWITGSVTGELTSGELEGGGVSLILGGIRLPACFVDQALAVNAHDVNCVTTKR